jgi:hypothetical protein
VRTDLRGALSHSSHPPVARFATGFDNLRIDTRTVVTKPQTQVRGVIGDLDFNAFRTCMVEGVY